MKVSKIIRSALMQLNIIASGENATAEEVIDSLDCLKDMLAQWATERLYIYKAKEITIPLSIGLGQYQILSTGITSISETAFLDDEEFRIYRDLNDIPIDAKVVYSVQEPNWIFDVRHVAQNLKIKAFTLPYDLEPNDELDFPAHYERALKLSLALEIAPMFGVEPSPTLLRNQMSAIQLLKNSNTAPMWVVNELPVGVCKNEQYY